MTHAVKVSKINTIVMQSNLTKWTSAVTRKNQLWGFTAFKCKFFSVTIPLSPFYWSELIIFQEENCWLRYIETLKGLYKLLSTKVKLVSRAACWHFSHTFWGHGKALGARRCKNNAQGLLHPPCMTGAHTVLMLPQSVQSRTGGWGGDLGRKQTRIHYTVINSSEPH